MRPDDNVIVDTGKGKNPQHRLSAADTIAMYLTEKRLAANPFAREVRDFEAQVGMFALCSESMLSQFMM
jgi:hypothetical protein